MPNLTYANSNLLSRIRHHAIESSNLKQLLTSTLQVLEDYCSPDAIAVYISVKSSNLHPHCALVNGKLIDSSNGNFHNGNGVVQSGVGTVGDVFTSELRLNKLFSFCKNLSAELDLPDWYGEIDLTGNIFAVPLMGEARILGALEFVNAQIHESEEHFITNAYLATQIISISISSLLRNELLQVIHSSSLRGMDVIKRQFDLEDFLQFVAHQVIKNKLINYDVCVIRLMNTQNEVEIEKVEHYSDITMKNFTSTIDRKQNGIATQVFNSKKPVEVIDINEKTISFFANKAWVQDNEFRSFICIPIIINSKCVGTLSLFLRYPYRFHQADHNLLGLLAHSIGKTIILFYSQAELLRVTAESDRNKVREISRIQSVQEFAHYIKNDIRLVASTLKEVIPTLTKGRTKELEKLSVNVNDTVNLIQEYIENSRGYDGLSEPFSMNELVQEILNAYKSESDLKNILTLRTLDMKPDTVVANRDRVKEAITNIYQNAIKACEESEKRRQKKIGVSTYFDKSNDELCIQITDNGIGIDNDDIDEIFNDGFSKFRKLPGTGKGLFFSNEIVGELIGEIDV